MSHALASSPTRTIAWLVLAALVFGLPHALVRCTPKVGQPHIELRCASDCDDHPSPVTSVNPGDGEQQTDDSFGCRHDRIGSELAPAPLARKVQLGQPLALDPVTAAFLVDESVPSRRGYRYGTGPPRPPRALLDRRTTQLRE